MFVFNIIPVYIPCKNLRTFGKFPVVSMWFRVVIDSNNNSIVQRYSHLEIPTKYQHLSGITILVSMSRFFDTIIDVGY